MNKKLRIYLDTSVINFLFADDAPEKKEVTIDFFQNYLNDFEVYISEIVIQEINKTNNKTKMELLLNTIQKYNIKIFDELNNDIKLLAENYLTQGIVPQKKMEDALHLAFATYYEFDILLSWNFKHLANINVQRKVVAFNLINGYNKQLLLLNPMEVVYDKG
ncbi:MAG: type II toxin-antitoxin system VapC family toxin [Candidatus Kapabacteria bacterium]|nr:type II toxin-antitoxin system VapC family toxin [Candidatus Kapabacteria bacterium]